MINSEPGLPVKIGITENIMVRLATLQVGNWNKLEAHWFSFVARDTGAKRNLFNSLSYSAQKLERLVHKKMHELDLSVGGEWFDCDPEAAVLVIRKVAAMNGFEFFDISAMQNLIFHNRLPKETYRMAEKLVNAEFSARRAKSVDISC